MMQELSGKSNCRERRAYICDHKDHQRDSPPTPVRVFLLPGDPEPPRCPKGHVMQRQPNKPYRREVTSTTN